MILIAGALLCLASVPLFGGRLAALGRIELRGLWAPPVALAAQVVILVVAPAGSPALHAAVHVATYVLAGGFLWANRRLPGAVPIMAGTALNVLAIITNRGVMPATPWAQRVAGIADTPGFHNSAPVAHAHLAWLGDIIPVPGPWPLGNVLSVGDLILFAGFVVLLHRTCRVDRYEQAPVAGR